MEGQGGRKRRKLIRKEEDPNLLQRRLTNITRGEFGGTYNVILMSEGVST